MEEPGVNLESAVIFLILLCVSAGLGFFINSRLPERHQSQESMELVQLAITLLVTFTAIVLGLLTTSVKAGFDDAYKARGDYASQLAQMDRCLRDYGPETQNLREQLRAYVAAVIASTWPDEPRPANLTYPDTSKMSLTGEDPTLGAIMNDVGLETRSLQASDELHRTLRSACAEQYRDLVKARWKVIEGVRGSISAPFYWVLVFWFAILFASFGVIAKPNAMSVTVIFLSALSIAVSIFVILDMDLPYGGLFGIPSTSMRNALADMMR